MKIEDAIYNTCHEYGIEQLALNFGASKNTVQHKANKHDPKHYFTPRELVSIQAHTRNFSIAHAMAGELGGQFIEPANFAHLGDEALLDMFAKLMARCGTFAGDFQTAWADGRLDMKEFSAICNDLYQVKQVCAELESRMATLVETRPRAVAGANVERFRPGGK